MDNVLMRQRHKVAGLVCTAVLCAFAGAGCTKVQARTPGPAPVVEAAPPLETPAPPSRLKVPVPIDAPATPSPTNDKPGSTANRPKPAIPPASTTAPPATPPETTPVVQAPADFEQRARERLARAKADLGKVQKNSLPPDAQEQFVSANRFVRMAEEAITARHFVYASYCADKAATLASLLVKVRLR